MKGQTKRILLGALVHLVAWFAIDLLINQPLSPPKTYSFAEFLPWWSALYFGYVFRVPIASLIPLAFCYLVLFALESWFGWNVIYHDTPSFFSFGFWLAYLFSFAIFASPIVANACMRWLQSKLAKL